jgi:hypothetical protein
MAKIRKGFVSNSSSSSFVITGDIQTDKMVVTIDLSDFGTLCKTEEDIRKYYEDQWGEYDPEDYRVAANLELIQEGKAVFLGQIDNNMVEVLDYLDGDFEVEVDY